MKIKKTVGMAIVAVALVLGTVATWHWYSDKTVLTQSQCGKVQLASMNWASAEFMASVDKFILDEGYGCNVEVVPGATETTFASMNDKGKPDVAPELWANAFIDALDKAIDEGRLISANDAPIAGLGEGWWITPATAKRHPQLKTVLDVLDNPQLFPDVEDSSKGAFITCPAGWGCQLANANLFRAFEMEKKGWKLVDPGSAAGLDGSMTKAVERDQNWFGYYWTPTAMIGKHKMIKLDYGVPFAGLDNWNGCIALAEQDCADPKPSAWTVSEVRTVVTDDFKKTAGKKILRYLKKRTYPGEVMNEMLVYMGENQAGGDDAAAEFFSNYESVWSGWVSKKVAKKIKASL